MVLFVLGLNVRRREKLPLKGPAIFIANHNSHLDTMVLMTLLPKQLLPIAHPVAAADYFLRNPLLAWFALKIIGIIPMKRNRERKQENPLQPCIDALNNDQILIFFPEGSRGEPENLSNFKGGIARIAEQLPNVPVIPILLHGLGKSLPKGEALLVPFFCDVFIGEPIIWTGNRKSYMEKIHTEMEALSKEGGFSAWE